MKQWYLVQLKPNSFRLAERNLQRQGFETFLPLQEISRRKNSRFTADFRPLFPGYMFVCFEINAPLWHKINSTIGVSRLVTFANQYKPIPLNLISNLMLRCNKEGKLLPPKKLNTGDSIKILNGPFANFVTSVERIDARQRIWVLMEFMGQRTKMQIAPDNVQLAT